MSLSLITLALTLRNILSNDSSSKIKHNTITAVLTQGGTETQEPAASLHAWRDPLRDKMREVVRGLSLADTQTARYGQIY